MATTHSGAANAAITSATITKSADPACELKASRVLKEYRAFLRVLKEYRVLALALLWQSGVALPG